MPQVILWGMGGMGVPLSPSRSWGVLMRVVTMTVVVICSFVCGIEMGVLLDGSESTIVLVTK